eukprot:CAMPEP_0202967418 /NCGR_PEP_ID=MMETSP1396-20130829/12254_1 /ASSEMBLY_ACC=CAM_ASM_000872 /TAXON_ID= /ORGANISM="Pseudokeronopsis sp., Strain Brazil" /LENGTH=91 /DNA_ID=CAMNT_0049692413 /DNA_START=610 /DNA_END=885 /DNA_ORIENTATION=-
MNSRESIVFSRPKWKFRFSSSEGRNSRMFIFTDRAKEKKIRQELALDFCRNNNDEYMRVMAMQSLKQRRRKMEWTRLDAQSMKKVRIIWNF